jgi:hypothetical protein
MTRDLPHPPTTRRVFQAEETLAWALEVYTSKEGARAEGGLTTAIVDTAGREVVRRVAARPTSLPFSKTWRVVDREPLAALPPGAYVLRLEARAGTVSAVREIPFTTVGKNR